MLVRDQAHFPKVRTAGNDVHFIDICFSSEFLELRGVFVDEEVLRASNQNAADMASIEMFSSSQYMRLARAILLKVDSKPWLERLHDLHLSAESS